MIELPINMVNFHFMYVSFVMNISKLSSLQDRIIDEPEESEASTNQSPTIAIN